MWEARFHEPFSVQVLVYPRRCAPSGAGGGPGDEQPAASNSPTREIRIHRISPDYLRGVPSADPPDGVLILGPMQARVVLSGPERVNLINLPYLLLLIQGLRWRQ
ncbi:hypothetical protein NL676_028281 [Syzygium grande]|nr:hypothetical protein NL676_028281 [Syzygium grande]